MLRYVAVYYRMLQYVAVCCSNLSICSSLGTARYSNVSIEGAQRHVNRLIHVDIFVIREATHEMHLET